MPHRRRAAASPRRKTASRNRTASTKKSAAPRKRAPSRKSVRRIPLYDRLAPYGVITALPGRPLAYTPALKAYARRRYEEMPESVYAIAADLGIHPFSLRRLAKREGWVRHNPPPKRDITGVMRLAAEADALVRARAEPAQAIHTGPLSPTPALPLSGGGSPTELAAPAAPAPDAIDRLEAAVLKELAVIERMRAHLGNEALRPLEAQVTARTLASLTDTLSKLRRLRTAAQPQAQSQASDDDDVPEDIDESRMRLCAKIDAFVASERAREAREAALAPPPAPDEQEPGPSEGVAPGGHGGA